MRQVSSLLDHLVGAGDEQWRQVEAERASRFEVDRQIELGWQLDRQVGGLGALQDAVHIAGGAPEQVAGTLAP